MGLQVPHRLARLCQTIRTELDDVGQLESVLVEARIERDVVDDADADA